MNWFVYILECSDGTLYCGIAKDLEGRIRMHEEGKGAKYTKGRGPFRLVYAEGCGGHKEAAQREIEIKGWTREKKLKLVGNPSRAQGGPAGPGSSPKRDRDQRLDEGKEA